MATWCGTTQPDVFELLTRAFGQFRWRVWPSELPKLGPLRVVDIQQSIRPMTDVCADILREQVEYADVIADFHRAWFASRQTVAMTFYEGIPVLKNPLDLWIVQEIIWDLKPTLIIETGTAFGGSALYYARQLDRLGVGHVVSIDIDPAATLPKHDRITYVTGNSVAPEMIDAVAQCCYTHPRVMVVLDSDHSKEHVLRELDEYSPFVSDDQFLIVEDTNINGRPVQIDWKGGPGPGPAVDEWLPKHDDFERAVLAERYMLTCHPGGWLRRRRARQPEKELS